ncbi:MAG: FimV/HubP family polar landmark protein, partial [Wohlfahrtiimonas sp.]
EPEPGIVELLFENIVYVGAGALVLILGLLAVVIRRRKQGGEPKQPKEKKEKVVKAPKEKAEKSEKKSFSLFGKKKDAQATDAVQPKEKKSKGLFGKKVAEPVVEEVDVAVAEVQVPTETPIAKPVEKIAPVVAATVATAAAVAAVTAETKVVKEEPVEIDSLDFDLSFGDIVVSEPVKEEAAIEGLDFDLSSMDLDVKAPVVEVAKEEVVDGLDFDLSSLDLGTAVQAPEVVKDEESMGGLDFDLSSLDLGAPIEAVNEVKAEVEDYGGLDFDLSMDDLNTSTPTQPVASTSTEKEADAFDSLAFDISDFAAPAVEAVAVPEEKIDYGTALDFDLGDMQVEAVAPAVEAVVEDSFGENNPLFATQSDAGMTSDPVEMEEDTSNHEPAEYISFPDLLDNAEDALVKDDIEAEKPMDFGSFLEDEEAGLANLIETSKKAEEADSKIDLSFVADATEDEAGLAFLDSLDLSEEAVLEDPINSSVKDNVTRSDESVEALHSAVDVPELIDLPEMVEAVDVSEMNIDLPMLEPSFVDNLQADAELMDIDIPEITLVEPTIEEIAEPIVEIIEPVIEPIIEEIAPVIESIEIATPAPVVPHIQSPVEEIVVNEADFESEQVKLELAVAYMDFDKSLAKPLLDEVIKDGSPKQIEHAQALLAQIN